MTDTQREEDDLGRAIHHHSRLGQDDAKRLAPILLGHMRQLGYAIEHPSDPIGTAQELIEHVALEFAPHLAPDDMSWEECLEKARKLARAALSLQRRV